MNRRTSALAGLIIALLLTVFTYAASKSGEIPYTMAVVTTQAIPQDTTISPSWLKLVAIPKPAMLPGMSGTIGMFAGHYASQPISADSYMMASETEPLPLRQGLCPGEVGISVPISNAANAVGVYPGAYINVVHATANTTAQGSMTVHSSKVAGEPGLIAAGVRVVAVATSSGALVTGPTYVNQQGQLAGMNINGSGTPSVVELAIPAYDQSQFADAINQGGISMSPAPWTAPASPKELCANPNSLTPGLASASSTRSPTSAPVSSKPKPSVYVPPTRHSSKSHH